MENTLVAWLNTFQPLYKDVESFEDLTDGIVLADVLSQMIPNYMDSGRIKPEAESNDLLKLHNMKKIVESLQEFYEMEVSLSIDVEISVDKIVKEKDENEMKKLIQFILGIAVQCEQKIEYVKKIQGMNADDQRELMVLINEVLSPTKEEETPSSTDDSSQYLNEILELKKEKAQLQHELEEIKEREESLESECEKLRFDHEESQRLIENLQRELKDARIENKELENKLFEKENELFEKENDTRKDEEYHEALRVQEALSEELEKRNKEVMDLQKQLEELSKSTQEAAELKDENEILKEQCSQLTVLEERLVKYQKKAEMVNELKQQVKILEEKNNEYLKTKFENEDSAKRLSSLKSQLDSYKNQVTLLTAEKDSQAIKLEEKTQMENVLNEKVHNMQLEMEHKNKKIEELRKEMELIRQEYQAELHSHTDDSIQGVTDFSMKEKLVKLQMENEKLKKGEGSERVAELENQLDDSLRLNKKYAQDIETLKKQLSSKGGEISLPLDSESSKFKEEYEIVLASKKEIEAKHKDSLQRIDKLEGYLRTAKTMIKDEKKKVKDFETIVATLNQTVEKQNKDIGDLKESNQKLNETNQDLQKKLGQGKVESEREIKLLSSMIYSVGLELQRLKAPNPKGDHLSGSRPKPKSFLAKAREES